MLLIVDGPEKAGKTTFCRALAEELGFKYRHWGKPESPAGWMDPLYAEVLRDDVRSLANRNARVVWDRSWAADYVYGVLCNRANPSRDDPWLLEWTHGRAVTAVGRRVMLLGPGGELQFGGRTPDDQPCDPHAERELYRVFGYRFGWEVVENSYTDESLEELVNRVQTDLELAKDWGPAPRPPERCGPRFAQVVFLGEALSSQSTGAQWLPFGTRYPTGYGRALGDLALKVAWTNVEADPHDEVTRADLVVACGGVALEYAQARTSLIHAAPHPSWLYRWGAARHLIEQHEAAIRTAVEIALEESN